MVRAGVAVSLLLCGAALGQDLANGKDVNGTCAACHGSDGRGGKMGEYPRLAGQRVGYLAAQLRNFQVRKRKNMPMFPYTRERELNEKDLRDVSAYLSGVVLPSKPPVFKPTDSALFRLTSMEAVLTVPRVKGDAEHGAKVFKRKCASCHGKTGRGKKDFPVLVGQYPNYLLKQVAFFRAGERTHEEADPADGVFAKLGDADVQDIFAWLTSIQGQQQEQDEEPEPEHEEHEPEQTAPEHEQKPELESNETNHGH